MGVGKQIYLQLPAINSVSDMLLFYPKVKLYFPRGITSPIYQTEWRSSLKKLIKGGRNEILEERCYAMHSSPNSLRQTTLFQCPTLMFKKTLKCQTSQIGRNVYFPPMKPESRAKGGFQRFKLILMRASSKQSTSTHLWDLYNVELVALPIKNYFISPCKICTEHVDRRKSNVIL